MLKYDWVVLIQLNILAQSWKQFIDAADSKIRLLLSFRLCLTWLVGMKIHLCKVEKKLQLGLCRVYKNCYHPFFFSYIRHKIKLYCCQFRWSMVLLVLITQSFYKHKCPGNAEVSFSSHWNSLLSIVSQIQIFMFYLYLD